jgi:hypothetical protein
MYRATAMASAFINAAAAQINSGNANPDKGTGNWIARRTAINADRPRFGMVYEGRSSSQVHPRIPRDLAQAHADVQSFQHDAQLDQKTIDILANAFIDVHTELHGTAHLQAQLTDDEVLGID